MQLKKTILLYHYKCVNGFPPLALVILLNALSFSKTPDFKRRKNIYLSGKIICEGDEIP
jgi:hypothetical protein